MFCEKCGNALPENARFCNRCGTPVTEQSVPLQPQQATPIPMAQPELFDATPLAFTRENGYMPLGEPVAAPQAATPQPEKKPRKRGWLITLIAVLVLVFTGGVTYAVMSLTGGARESAMQSASRNLEQTWYMVGQPSVMMTFRSGSGTVTQSTGIPLFDYTLAEFTYEIVDAEHIRITTGSKTGEFDLVFSDNGTVVSFTPTLFGAANECWTTNRDTAQAGTWGNYRNG